MSVPDPLVEMYLGGSWVDVSTGVAPNRWLDTAAAPLTITRGRENEQADIAAGTCTFSLVNDDGRFTLANPAGAYSPNFKLWVQVRVTINGVREFTGYLSNAETSWDDDTGLNAHTAITCTDLLGMMAMSPNVRPWSEAAIAALSPLYWWKLDDVADSLAGVEVDGGPSLVATLGAAGDGAAALTDLFAFGVEGPASLESGTQVAFTPTDAESTVVPGYAYLASSGTVTGLPTLSSGITVLLLYTPRKSDFGGAGPLVWLQVGTLQLQITDYGNGTLLVQSANSSPVRAANATVSSFFVTDKPRLIAVTVTTTTVAVVGTSATFTRPAGDEVSMDGSTVYVGSVPGGGDSIIGDVSNIAILPGVMSAGALASLQLQLLGGTGLVVDWLNRASSEAGYAPSVTATLNRVMERPALKGSNPAEMGNILGNSSGAMFATTKTGVPKWLDFTDAPTRIDIAAGEWERGSAWAPDQSLYYSEVQFDGVVAATVPGAFPRKALDVQPLLPPTEQAAYATYLTNAQDVITGPRLSQISIDLATVATPATYQAIDLRSRIALAAVPSQIPAGGVMTVEGYTVSVGVDSWRLTLSTAPDPRFILGDSVSGVMESNNRISPFQ